MYMPMSIHAHAAHDGLRHHVADEIGACASNPRSKADETSVSDYRTV